MTREEREDAIDIIQSILIKYEEDECLVTEITIGDEDAKAFKMAIEALEQEPKIKVLDRDEVARKLGTVDIYTANAWITLLKDLEFLGLKICEVKE